MFRLGKGIAFFFIFCGMFVSSHFVVASNIESLSWLPLLTASMKKLQPDINCAQNQINDLQVSKSGQQIKSHIRQINWDLNCTQGKGTKIPSEENQQQQIALLLKQLSALPKFNLNINAINLTSELLKTTFTSNLLIKKHVSKIVLTFKSNLLTGNLSLNLKTKKLVVEANVTLDKLSDYIHLSEQQSRYFNDQLSLYYQSDLNQWQKGTFKIDWQGSLPELSNHVELSVVGNLDLLKEQLTLSTLLVNAKQVLVPVSDTQDWKTGYIKIKNSDLIRFNYAQINIDNLPVHIRVGSSSLLTKVARGTSKRIRIDKQKLPPVFMQFAISGKETDLLVDWGVTLLNQKLVGKLFLAPDIIKLQLLENNIELKLLVESSRRYIDGLDLLEIEKGIIKLNLLAQYQRQEKTMMLESQVVTDAISGKQETFIFDGATFSSRLHYLVDKENNISILEDTQQLKIANLFVGLPIQALQVDAILAAGKPVVQHFKARLLGGRLDFDDFKLTAPSQTILSIGGISLAEVIKYSAYPEIKSQGIIDGMLPLTLTSEGPEITDGIIFARPPGGYIKVPENTVIKAMGQNNPAFSLTMQILSNFQFDTMLGRIGYTSDGESDLKIEIKGISPTISGKQPVDFNYSHNENILKLLKTLRFNDELARHIKERY